MQVAAVFHRVACSNTHTAAALGFLKKNKNLCHKVSMEHFSDGTLLKLMKN